MVKRRKAGKARTMEERMRIAQEINAYRAAHPHMVMVDVMKNFPGISDSNYYAWEERRKTVEAIRKANGAGEEQHFPLAAIPDRPTATKVKPGPRPREDNYELAAQLLEVAAKLLRR